MADQILQFMDMIRTTDLEREAKVKTNHRNFWAPLKFRVDGGDNVLVINASRNTTPTPYDIQNHDIRGQILGE